MALSGNIHMLIYGLLIFVDVLFSQVAIVQEALVAFLKILKTYLEFFILYQKVFSTKYGFKQSIWRTTIPIISAEEYRKYRLFR